MTNHRPPAELAIRMRKAHSSKSPWGIDGVVAVFTRGDAADIWGVLIEQGIVAMELANHIADDAAREMAQKEHDTAVDQPVTIAVIELACPRDPAITAGPLRPASRERRDRLWAASGTACVDVLLSERAVTTRAFRKRVGCVQRARSLNRCRTLEQENG